jgi:hypothetical protein
VDPAGWSHSRTTRRRFIQMAAVTTAGVVLPIPRVWAADEDDYCTPGMLGIDSAAPRAIPTSRVANEVIVAPRDGKWPADGGSHFSSSPRRAYIMVHHAGIANSHDNPECTSCNVPGDHVYDFCIARNGDICNTGQWRESTGGHAQGCNCDTVGIMMQGCFGGCTSGNVGDPSNAQLCSLAWLSLHLGTPATLNRHRPHRRCASWNPCNSSDPTATVCPGSHLTNNDADRWDSNGEALMNRMLVYRDRISRGCSCYSEQTCA